MNIDHPTVSQIPLLRELWQEAFGDGDGFLDSFFSTGFCPDRCLTAWEDDRLAAALYWFDCRCRGERCAYIYAVATGKAFRGRGLCHILMDRLHCLLKEQGYAMAILVPGSESLFRLYAGMGYERFGGMEELRCCASAPVAIRQLSAQEYAARRRVLLPEGAVLQEGSNLDFLQTQASFYAGEDFLLCASIHGDSLFAPELLGNTDAAGGILAALGCREGRFRTPGQNPFAMVKLLSDCEKPEYFAFAFD